MNKYKTAKYCEIHVDEAFPIDGDCNTCLENEVNEKILPYIEHIEFLEKQIKEKEPTALEIEYFRCFLWLMEHSTDNRRESIVNWIKSKIK